MSTHVFDADTAVSEIGPGRYRGSFDRRWWIVQGPNGGIVAAVILRALTAAVDDPDRRVRSLTIHYTAPPQEGDVEVQTEVVRRGGALTTVAGRLVQGGQVMALALAAFSRDRKGFDFDETRMPDVPAWDATERVLRDPATAPPITEQYDLRPTIGAPPFSGADEARTGGWIAFAEPRPLDDLALAAMSDGWLPAVFVRATTFVAAPTIDLTIHFRAAVPEGTEHCLGVFSSTLGAHGFWEEDGELWSPDGRLLVHSRQLALAIPLA